MQYLFLLPKMAKTIKDFDERVGGSKFGNSSKLQDEFAFSVFIDYEQGFRKMEENTFFN